MATFVLVHGAWHGGWCWKNVTPLLRAGGHDVFTPTLTGLGERAHLLTPAIDLNTHIQDVMAVLEYEDLQDVVLVGHNSKHSRSRCNAPPSRSTHARRRLFDAQTRHSSRKLANEPSAKASDIVSSSRLGMMQCSRCHGNWRTF